MPKKYKLNSTFKYNNEEVKITAINPDGTATINRVKDGKIAGSLPAVKDLKSGEIISSDAFEHQKADWTNVIESNGVIAFAEFESEDGERYSLESDGDYHGSLTTITRYRNGVPVSYKSFDRTFSIDDEAELDEIISNL